MRVGITGHSDLTAEATPIVADAIRRELMALVDPIVGVSCLARGADQVFARVVVDGGGGLDVVLPAADYRDEKVKPENRRAFEALLAHAEHVDVLPFDTSNRLAYEAANDRVLTTIDMLFAVWDGRPPDGRGGTGDTVRIAKERGIPVVVIWPNGARRSSG